ncbi:MAG: HU family DNA-binding protein [Bacteroidales bacterium]|nr:HU family DNA-binding protein [Bacteroidales bacterium]
MAKQKPAAKAKPAPQEVPSVKEEPTVAKKKTAVAKEKEKEKPAAAKNKMTKAAFFQKLAEATQLKKSEVQTVYDAILAIVQKELGPKGPGELTLPNLVKLSVTHTKADKGGKKAINRFTGEEYVTKPRPAKTKLKARGLKSFLESINTKK